MALTISALTASGQLDGRQTEPGLTQLVQIALHVQGLYSDKIDGIAGPNTRAALLRYLDTGARSLLSPSAEALVIEFEVGGGEAYYRKHLARPTWPGESSGVTIGIGYDLGQNTADQIRADWSNVVSPAILSQFVRAAGITGEPAKALAVAIGAQTGEIAWALAWAVFQRSTVPRFIALTRAAFPGADKLPADAFGALVSLVFNRGSAMEGDRRREMKAIRELVRSGSATDLQNVPAQITAMKRLWPDSAGLRRRRDAEAALFAKAIA